MRMNRDAQRRAWVALRSRLPSAKRRLGRALRVVVSPLSLFSGWLLVTHGVAECISWWGWLPREPVWCISLGLLALSWVGLGPVLDMLWTGLELLRRQGERRG